mmetsp:Transcript_42738/g.142216  ORF Transcript_42738/g.142216 Transcript_42738/m.142216 type:complete len:266 (+) Transcript_42738:829-1626(+)
MGRCGEMWGDVGMLTGEEVPRPCGSSSLVESARRTSGLGPQGTGHPDTVANARPCYTSSRPSPPGSASFADEITPVTVKSRKGDVTVTADDECAPEPRPASAAKPAFKKNGGTVTAANASTISDGAAALVLMSRSQAEAAGAPILATIRSSADAEQEPCWFTTAPAAAIPKALARAGLAISDVDFFEINEAFSVVSVANNQLLGLDPTRVNVRGGAVSIGHPIGASGARIVVTLLSVLREKGGKIGVAGICNGGGGASAIVIEAE